MLKVTALFIVLSAGMLQAHTYGQRLNMTGKSMSLQQVFLEIRKQTGYNVLGRTALLKGKVVDQITWSDMEMAAALTDLLLPFGLTYEISGKNILVIDNAQKGTQELQVQGTVRNEKGEPLAGVSVQGEKDGRGVTTDAQGAFRITLSAAQELVFSYLGYQTYRVQVARSQALRIALKPEEVALSEVVVTALGIKRERKSLGYAVDEVDTEEMQKTKDVNVINSLAGRVAGLVIDQTATGPGGSTRVLLRGYTEMTGNNQPLYVVDGIPLDNTNFASAGQFGGFDLGDGISGINPDDIESISVLKGPAASALYGSRAGHGVILITTKKGSRTAKKWAVELNSTNTVDMQSVSKDKLQYVYGQGSDGRISTTDNMHTNNTNWGAKIDPGIQFLHFDGERRPYVPIADNIDGFYRMGVTNNNTLVLNSSTDANTIRLSYNDLRNRDIVPNSNLSRNNLGLRTTSKVGERLDVDVKVNYMKEFVKNRPALGGFRSSIGSNLMTLATTFDQDWLRENYKTADGEYYDWNNRDPYNVNPYWIINEMRNESTKDRLMSSAVLKYKLSSAISLQMTGGTDFNTLKFLDFAPPTTPGRESGYLQERTYENRTWNLEFLASYAKKWADFDLGVRAGGNIFHVNNHTGLLTGIDMKQRNLEVMSSFDTQTIDQLAYRKQINSAFGMFNIGYRNWLFADATLRVDHASSLTNPVGGGSQNTYVYPSFSGSFVYSDLLKLDSRWLSYGKLRASWARVGKDTDPFLLALNYAIYNKSYPGYNIGSIYNAMAPNAHLKPTMTNSYELGLENKFFNNRVSLDLTFYNQTSSDQILKIASSAASGYSQALINAGSIQNKGIEATLGVRPIERTLKWDMNLTFARNLNKVLELQSNSPGQDFELEAARWADVRVAAVVGERYGSIMGRDYLYAPNGEILIDSDTGLPRFTSSLQVLGSAAWDWTGGISNRFSYKNWSFSSLIDVKVGADLYSMTARSDYMSGKTVGTLEGRDAWLISEEQRQALGINPGDWQPTGGYVAHGVVEEVDGSGAATYRANDRFVSPEVYWKYIGAQTPLPFIYDNSYVKLREVSITYRLPGSWIRFATDAQLSLVARNPWIIYKNIPNIDPESNYNNGSGMGLEYGSIPTRRSFGLNLNMKF
ncbi:SusC/RagA family TonB-linked outer membrane protein [Sphingobacterium sp. SGG-5]|uniref:SusC/RagA family TonB-linked outer membrane protein n=1 Tax=Sphingobacterium sp. SGG-5 TaxID=2710881 RepID=UPI0019D18749|nr:SusC/RagA family TonB-linked outer membrane protein [Sphingobacterium sp. SGG-5]